MTSLITESMRRNNTYLQMQNLNNDNTTIIIGNPGCGKTTKLVGTLRHLHQEMNIPLSQIAYFSFSTAAIQEAIQRTTASVYRKKPEESLSAQDSSTLKSTESSMLISKEGCQIQNSELQYFKTLHAMAFHLLNLSPEQLMKPSQCQEFGELVSLPMTGETGIYSGAGYRPTKKYLGDRILNIISTADLENIPIRDYMIKHKIEEIPVHLVIDTAERYRDYKIINNLYDYTDMLVMAKNRDFDTPQLDHMLIDEAQDLSRLAWMLIDKMAKTTKSIIIAGDDKQAINLFAAADVQTFLHLPGKVECLEQSYRIPMKSFRLANRLMSKMHNFRKEGASWKPRDEEGVLKTVRSLPIMSMLTGKWLVLARAGYQLDKIRDDLLMLSRDGALPFTVLGRPPIDMDIFRVIGLFELAKTTGRNLNDLITLKDTDRKEIIAEKYSYISLLKRFISCDTDRKLQEWEVTPEFREKLNQPWITAMDKVPWYIRAYAQRLVPLYREKGDSMFDDVPVKLTTIHRAKGSEEDNVIILMDLPKKVITSMYDPDDDTELKIFYTAVTRARKKLYLYTKTSKTSLTYDHYL